MNGLHHLYITILRTEYRTSNLYCCGLSISARLLLSGGVSYSSTAFLCEFFIIVLLASTQLSCYSDFSVSVMMGDFFRGNGSPSEQILGK